MYELKPGIKAAHLGELYYDPYVLRGGAEVPVLGPSALYLSAFVDGVFAGAFLCMRRSELELSFHALLKEVALPHSRELGRLAVQWAFDQPGVERLGVYLPEAAAKTANYCRKVGLSYEGTLKSAARHQGAVCDVLIFGLSRKDYHGNS